MENQVDSVVDDAADQKAAQYQAQRASPPYNIAGSGAIGYPSYYPQPTAEQIAKSDRCQALSYAMQACGHMGDGDHIVNVAKILEAYLKGEVMGSDPDAPRKS